MRLSTRLLLPLLAVVAVVMLLYTAWSLRQREITLTAEARREAQAYAVALEIAIEAAFRDPELSDVQRIVDWISRERTIYGVLVYGPRGELIFRSDPLRLSAAAPPEQVQQVLETRQSRAFERRIDQQDVYSVLRPVLDEQGRIVGAFEVAQPLSFLAAEKARTRQRFFLNTLTLLAAVTVLILWLVRTLIARPLQRLATAAHALARGDLAHRIPPDPRGGELAELSDEWNRMAGRLEAARADLLREAEERVALERRLRETEKLAAIGNLAAGVAHEIGAPLHVIRGRAELLLARGEMPPAEARNLRIIAEQIQRITHIVRNLLDFARRREPRRIPVDVCGVATTAAELLEPEFTRTGVAFHMDCEVECHVIGDPDLLHQVFINLFLNALQALGSAEEGERRIHCRIIAEERPADASSTIRVEVSDTGTGIQEDALPHIFEPFFTTKPGGQGTGLGLAVVRSIVDEHGGTIEAVDAAADSRGARFRITLPAAVPELHDA